MRTFFTWTLRLRWWVLALIAGLTVWLGWQVVPLSKITFDFSFNRLFLAYGGDQDVLRRFHEEFGDDVGLVSILLVLPEDGGAGAGVLAGAGRGEGEGEGEGEEARKEDAQPNAQAEVRTLEGTVFAPPVMHAIERLSRWLKERPEIAQGEVFSLGELSDLHGDSIRPAFLASELDALERVTARHGGWEALAQAPPQAPANPALAAALRRYRAAAQTILGHRLYAGQVVSRDALATAIVGRFRLDHATPASRDALLSALPAAVDGVRPLLPPGSEVYLSGVPVVEQTYARITLGDMVAYIPFISVVMSLLLLVLFRHLHALIIPMVGLGIATVWTLGVMQLQGEPLNVINNIIPVIVLVIGVAESVHILARYYQFAHEVPKERKGDAIVDTMVHMAPACLLASLTTAIGFGSLVSAAIPTIRSFGLYAGLAIVFAFALQMTFIPVALSLVPRPRTDRIAERKGTVFGHLLERLGDLVTRHTGAILVATVLVAVVSAVGIAQVSTESRVLQELDPSNPTARALLETQRRLSGVLVHAILFEGRVHEDRPCQRDTDCVDPTCDPTSCTFPDCCHTQVCKRIDRPWRLASGLRDVAMDLTDADELPLFTDLEGVIRDLRSQAMAQGSRPASAGSREGARRPPSPSPGPGAAPGERPNEGDEGDEGDEIVLDDGDAAGQAQGNRGGDGDSQESDEIVLDDSGDSNGGDSNGGDSEGGDSEGGDEIVLDAGDAPDRPAGAPAAAAKATAPQDALHATSRAAVGVEGVCAESVKDAAFVHAVARLDDWLNTTPEHRKIVSRVVTLVDLLREMNLALAGDDEATGGGYRLPPHLDRASISQLLWPLEGAGGDLLTRTVTRDYTATNATIYANDAGTHAWHALRHDLEAKLKTLFDDDPALAGRFRHAITGSSTLVYGALGSILHDMASSITLAFVFILLLLTVLFRSLRVGLVAMIPNVWPLFVTMALMGFAHIELRVSSVVIFSVSLGIAVDDTIHFLSRFREELTRTPSADEAIRITLHGTGRAIVLATTILIMGFLVNAHSDFIALKQFGLLSAFTLAVALAGDLVVLPALVRAFHFDRVMRPSSQTPPETVDSAPPPTA